MNTADDMPAKIEAPESTSAPADFGDKLDEHTSIADSEPAGEQGRPVEELRSLLLRISHHLDYETSERSTIYYRLLAIDAQGKRIEQQTKGRFFRALFRYAIVICLAIAGTLLWQTYGEAARQVIAAKAPELGWSPEAKETIASWVAQLGWTKAPEGTELSAVRAPLAETPQPIPVAQTASDAAEAKAMASVDPEQMQRIMQNLTTLQQSVGQLATTQDQIGRQITSLQANEVEILKRVPAPPPPPPVAPARKPVPAPLPRAPVH